MMDVDVAAATVYSEAATTAGFGLLSFYSSVADVDLVLTTTAADAVVTEVSTITAVNLLSSQWLIRFSGQPFHSSIFCFLLIYFDNVTFWSKYG